MSYRFSTGPAVQRGVTLIELMVTVSVLAILLAAAAPSFADYLERVRLRGATDELVAFIASARAEAIRLDRDVAITLAGSAANWCIGARSAANPASVGAKVPAATACDCSGDDANLCQINGATAVMKGADLNNIALVSGGSADIKISSKLGTLHTLTGSTFTFASPSGKSQISVAISPLGQARTCIPAEKPVISGVPSC